MVGIQADRSTLCHWLLFGSTPSRSALMMWPQLAVCWTYSPRLRCAFVCSVVRSSYNTIHCYSFALSSVHVVRTSASSVIVFALRRLYIRLTRKTIPLNIRNLRSFSLFHALNRASLALFFIHSLFRFLFVGVDMECVFVSAQTQRNGPTLTDYHQFNFNGGNKILK